MKMTLLEMVQRILEAADAQPVNSLKDTREAVQVANCIREIYYHMLYTREIKTRNNLCYVDSLSDVTKPTYLKFRDDVCSIDLFKYYDKAVEKYVDLQWKEPEQFINDSLNLNPNDDNVMSIQDFSGIYLNVFTDRTPTCFTSFDDSHIVLDAYNSAEENTIQQTNVVMYGIKLPAFVIEDDFVPDISPQHFGTLLSQSRVKAVYELNRELDSLERDQGMKEIITANRHARRVEGQTNSWWKNRPKTGRHII